MAGVIFLFPIVLVVLFILFILKDFSIILGKNPPAISRADSTYRGEGTKEGLSGEKAKEDGHRKTKTRRSTHLPFPFPLPPKP